MRMNPNVFGGNELLYHDTLRRVTNYGFHSFSLRQFYHRRLCVGSCLKQMLRRGM